ncbi:unnamed protein product [Lupinus luteus]|uniref:AP2/ERF domain-containing protein n=1 Tax=Lupinus luteus TaxID=3873 RepID=A0AAV1WNN8_LUPLU
MGRVGVTTKPVAVRLNGPGSTPAFLELRYRGVRKTPSGRFTAQTTDPLKKARVWLGTFDSAEEAARAYDAASRTFRGPKAKTNFSLPQQYINHHENFVPAVADLPDQRVHAAADGINGDQRPTSSGLSSTVESFSGPRPSSVNLTTPAITASRRYPRTPPVVPSDCHSGCDSSSSVVDNVDDHAVSSSAMSFKRAPLTFDLNVSPLEDADVALDGGGDLRCTVLCL